MVTGVILAAGQSRRMGEAKQLLPLGEKPMVWQVANTACQANFSEVLVITGAYREQVEEGLQDLPLRVIYNEDWGKGQSTSVKKALQSIAIKPQAIVFLLADQPLIDIKLINRLIDTYYKSGASIIVPCFQNRPGNPVLFDVTVWKSALLQLAGDEGARQIIRKNQEKVHYIEIEEEEIFLDVDTEQEYRKMEEMWQVFRKNNRIIK